MWARSRRGTFHWLSFCTKAGAAIGAGCTVVAKGSEVAPLTSFMFAEAFQEAGLAAGVLNMLSGSGAEVGEPLVIPSGR